MPLKAGYYCNLRIFTLYEFNMKITSICDYPGSDIPPRPVAEMEPTRFKQMVALNLTGKTGISSVKIRPPDESVMPKSGGF